VQCGDVGLQGLVFGGGSGLGGHGGTACAGRSAGADAVSIAGSTAPQRVRRDRGGNDAQAVWLALAAGTDPANGKIAAILHAWDQNLETAGATAKTERFLARVREGDTTAADAALDGLPIAMRAQALTAGSYLLGNRTPPAWRTFARRVLFSAERPYLGDV
jgi:hypothetical protein